MAFTYFFRDQDTLDYIAAHAIPELKQRRFINIWDAGCAMGPEPYSLAIILRENMGKFLFRNVRIFATDIDESDFGKTIAEGAYPFEQTQRIPDEIRERYFVSAATDGKHVVSEEIRSAVRFERHDLTSLKPYKTDLGLILCKNVLLHLTETQRVDVIRMFHAALMQGGFFAMEQTQKLPEPVSKLFKPVVSNAQLYRKVN